MAGSIHIPWYATGFRADLMEEALAEIAPVALRYGASSYQVFRMRDDRYKFLQVAAFADKADWERYWHGPEFSRWRALHSSHYQVPVIYGWADSVAEGALPYDPQTGEPVAATAGNGGNGR
jgi:hypothetical protein